MVFSTFTELCNHRHDLIFIHVLHSPEKPCVHLLSLSTSKPSHRQPTTHLCNFSFFCNIKGNVFRECIHFRVSLRQIINSLLTSQPWLSPFPSAVISLSHLTGRPQGGRAPRAVCSSAQGDIRDPCASCLSPTVVLPGTPAQGWFLGGCQGPAGWHGMAVGRSASLYVAYTYEESLLVRA